MKKLILGLCVVLLSCSMIKGMENKGHCVRSSAGTISFKAPLTARLKAIHEKNPEIFQDARNNRRATEKIATDNLLDNTKDGVCVIL
jgi:hypothetical protein